MVQGAVWRHDGACWRVLETKKPAKWPVFKRFPIMLVHVRTSRWCPEEDFNTYQNHEFSDLFYLGIHIGIQHSIVPFESVLRVAFGESYVEVTMALHEASKSNISMLRACRRKLLLSKVGMTELAS